MESQYVSDSIADDVRVDGRTRLALRDFSFKNGVNNQARGSSQVWLGETCVVCFVFSDVLAAGAGSSSSDTSNQVSASELSELSQFGLSVKSKIISSSGDVDQSTVQSVNQDLSALYRRIGEQPSVKEGLTSRIFKSCEHRCAVGVKVMAELTVLSGAGGNVLSACALAVKSALFDSSFPPVHVTPAAAEGTTSSENNNNNNDDADTANKNIVVPEPASVEVDEQRRESGKPLGMASPLVVKAITPTRSNHRNDSDDNNNNQIGQKKATSGTGYYCIDPCREEERAAAFEVIVGVCNNNNSSNKNTDDDAGATNNNSNNNNNNSNNNSSCKIVYSRIHSCANNNNSSSSSSSSSSEDLLCVSDVTTLLNESAAIGERLFDLWAMRL